MEIRYLVDVPEVIPALAASFQADGFAHPDDVSTAEIEGRLLSCARRDDLPLALVALDEQGVCGTVTLRRDSIASRPQLEPWLAALYVLPPARRCGVGSRLVRAAEAEALRLAFAVLYAGTSSAESLFRRLGWVVVERLEHAGTSMVICRQLLGPAA